MNFEQDSEVAFKTQKIDTTKQYLTGWKDKFQELKEELVSDKLFNKLGQHQEIQRVNEARQYLLDWQKKLQDQGFDLEVTLMYGRPIDSIIAIAEEINADLIAMTSQGRTGLDPVFSGSVASGILNRSTRPLLLVCTEKSAVAYIKNFV